MIDPNDEQREPDAPEGASPETSLGAPNLFEVEEQAPDGGPLGDSPATPDPLDDDAGDEPDAPPDQPAPEPPQIAHAEPEPEPETGSEPNDDDEPAPQLVWYVLKVQSGRETTIRDALERRVKIQGVDAYFGRIVVPTEKITEIRNNKKRIVERKSYPGYIMIEMELNEKTWFTVRETPGVGDFVGAHGTPSAMSEDEVNKMLGQVESVEKAESPKIKIYVERGDRVKIKDGPFENFEGTVEEVVEQRGLVKVMLIIFNRPTPVDLEYWQVERI